MYLTNGCFYTMLLQAVSTNNSLFFTSRVNGQKPEKFKTKGTIKKPVQSAKSAYVNFASLAIMLVLYEAR